LQFSSGKKLFYYLIYILPSISVLLLSFIINKNAYSKHLLILKIKAMKNLLLSMCFMFITSLIFCQTPAPQNTRVHLKYYAHNCVPFSSINNGIKSNCNESAISPLKSLLYMATDYYKRTDYSIVCSIGQDTWHKTAEVLMPWHYLNGSIRGLGFHGGYHFAIGVKKQPQHTGRTTIPVSPC
jgi:hypothetical protein